MAQTLRLPMFQRSIGPTGRQIKPALKSIERGPEGISSYLSIDLWPRRPNPRLIPALVSVSHMVQPRHEEVMQNDETLDVKKDLRKKRNDS